MRPSRLLVVALAFFPAVVLGGPNADLEFRITTQGEVDGYPGFFREMRINGILQETDFLFVEGEYVRWYSVRPAGQENTTLLPMGTFLIRRSTLNVGDAWTSWWEEPVTATVAARDTISSYDCYRIEYRNSQGELRAVSYASEAIGGSVRIIAGGQTSTYTGGSALGGGFLPLAVGNSWRYDTEETPVERSTWGRIKKLFD